MKVSVETCPRPGTTALITCEGAQCASFTSHFESLLVSEDKNYHFSLYILIHAFFWWVCSDFLGLGGLISSYVVCVVEQLKEFLKKCKVAALCKQVKQVVDKAEETAKVVEARRRATTFNLADIKAVVS